MTAEKQYFLVKIFFALTLLLQVLTWHHVRDVKGSWQGVPPVPGQKGLSAFFLGDRQLAYRATGIMLQNLGETGGHSEGFNAYDYNALRDWFFLSDALDPRSDFTPFLASFYYGAVKDPKKLKALLDYLYVAGNRPEGYKWRWLAQGVYIARFEMQDLDTALKFASALAAIDRADLPAWTKQMPVFILHAEGNRQEALALMIEILKSSADKMNPNELNFTRDYICTRLLNPGEAKIHPLCRNIP